MDREAAAALPETLARYLMHRLPTAGAVTVSNVFRSPGGNSRAMWFFDAEYEHDVPVSRTLAIRLNQTACFREPEVSLENEFRVYQVLHGTAVPVVANYWYESDPTWLGEPFVVRERLDGVRASIDGVSDELKMAVLNNFVDLLAAQHSLDWDALGLDWLGVPPSPEASAEFVVDRWERVFRRDQCWPDALIAAAFADLRASLPTKVSRIVLLQGQVGPNQLLWTGQGQILASLDWESALLGDPMSDLAFLVLNLRRAKISEEDIHALLDRYTALTGTPIESENIDFYFKFQTLWCAVTCNATGMDIFCSGEAPRLETLRLATLLPRHFIRTLEHLVTGL